MKANSQQIKLNYASAIRFLGKYMNGFKKNFIMFYSGWFVNSVLTVATPVLFGIMIDEIVYYQNVQTFIKISAVFLICILFSGGLYFLLYAQHGYLMNMFVFSIRRDIFDHLQKCDAGYLVNSSTGEILTILQNYTGQCMHFVIRNIIHRCNNIFVTVMYAIYLLVIDWRIGLIAILAAVCSVFINTGFKKKIRALGDQEREACGSYIGWMYEVITALRDIRMLGAQNKIEKSFEEKQGLIFSINIKNSILSLTAQRLTAFFNLAVQLTIYAISAYLAANGRITLGTLTVVFSFYTKLSLKIDNLSRNFLDAQNRVSYIQSIYDFLHTPKEPERSGRLMVTDGEILFSNVSFGYEGCDLLLKNITLRVRRKERLAIVGRSGCGKTTLAYLLIGFYQAKDGYIKIDGQDLKEIDLKSIRKEIGYIQQDVLIFDGSIRQNILMGNLHATEEDILSAYRAAGLEEFVDSLPDGLDTVIGSHGINLSGGQKQRVAIARIYLKNPKIVIFDEATSALDSETEEAIHREWKKALEGKTAIMIAHRQSTVMLCDRVVILEDGKIAETGSPGEMEKKSERFRTLFAIKEGDKPHEKTNEVPV